MTSTSTRQTTPIADRIAAEASMVMPGGVSAAARFHPALGRAFMTAHGEGARVTDVDGREYLDLEGSFGATLLGHGDARIRVAVEEALDLGVLCGHDTPHQTRLAQRLTELVPSAVDGVNE